MAKSAMASLAFAPIFGLATAATAQGGSQPSAAPSAADPSHRIQAQMTRHAEELRRTWIAAGHTAGPPPDNTSTCEIKPGGSNKILTPKLDVANPPAAPKIQVQIDNCPAAGFSSIYLYLYSMSNPSQSVYVYYSYDYFAPPVKKDTVKIQNAGGAYPSGVFSPYSVAGTYTLTTAYVYDRQGNYHTYDQPGLTALFPSTTVKLRNALHPDSTPPMFLSGAVLTPEVSKTSAWPAFQAKLNVSDDVSGLRSSWLYVCPPSGSGGNCASYSTYPPSPILSGSVTDSDYLCDLSTHDCSGVPKGTWTINGYGGCDLVDNCFYTYDSTDIQNLLGTTTFTVTR